MLNHAGGNAFISRLMLPGTTLCTMTRFIVLMEKNDKGYLFHLASRLDS